MGSHEWAAMTKAEDMEKLRLNVQEGQKDRGTEMTSRLLA